MENYPISISVDEEIHHFEIGEYLHHSGESCKVKVFQEGKLVASFEPDDYNCLRICQLKVTNDELKEAVAEVDNGIEAARVYLKRA